MQESAKSNSVISDKIKEIISPKNRGNLIIVLGITGLILIAFSGFFKTNSKKEATVSTSASSLNRQQNLQQSLENIISNVEGAGKSKVLITFENSAETIYATEEKKNKEACEDKSECGITRKKECDDCEKKYITIKDNQGTEHALAVTEIEPKVKGVIVICSGAENPIVERRIVDAVTTALNIPSKKVCVTKSA